MPDVSQNKHSFRMWTLNIFKASWYIDSDNSKQEFTDVTVEYISFSPSHHANLSVDQTDQKLQTL